MRVSEGDDDSLDIEGPLSFTGFAGVGRHHDYQSISVVKAKGLSAKLARALSEYRKVKKLWLWCDVYRTAMPHILSLPELEIVDILSVSCPGRRMCSFADAAKLLQFRCPCRLTETDLIAISSAPKLEELGAQSSLPTSRALAALIEMKSLRSVDLECAGISDTLAAQISESTTITNLELGGNPISDVGLAKICGMHQLKGLDVWATDVSVSGLERLTRLKNLEYLSLGEVCDDEFKFTGEEVIPILDSMPSLKKVWLDGVSLTSEQREMLVSRYEYFKN